MSTAPKMSATSDRRFNWQLFVLAMLTLLPIAMIAFNGYRAARMIMAREEPRRGSNRETIDATSSVSSPSKRVHIRFGVHDPEGVFADEPSLKIRHLFVSWADFDSAQLKKTLCDFEKREIEPLVTIEPWPIDGFEGPLLEGIAVGRYDSQIDCLADALNATTRPLMLAWGHEMDQDIATRYPWSGKAPEEYIRAYRYVVERMRTKLQSRARWVWAGVLKQGSTDYWPGDDCVDFIGMPIYSFPGWDTANYGYIRHFRKTVEEKIDVVRKFNKPLIITELGVNGSDDFESFWMHQAFLSLDAFPNLHAVVFFQAKDKEGAWGEKWGTPDWRLHPATIRGLVNWKLAAAAAESAPTTTSNLGERSIK